jgi:hypothetical protein
MVLAMVAFGASLAWAHGPHGHAYGPPAGARGREQFAGPGGGEMRRYAERMPGQPRADSPRYPQPGYPMSSPRSAYLGYGAPPPQAPPSHLGNWLNQHHNLSVHDQERMLRSDPSFRRLPPGDQQRMIEQLYQVDQLNEQQRQRRLGRAAMIERLSPQERMQVNFSARRWAALPPDRQAVMKHVFQNLRRVPLEQRSMVLNSHHYQGLLSPEERGILSDLLRIEPYQPPR